MKHLVLALALLTAATAHADTWVDGSVSYKFSGIDTHFPVAADDGTTSTMTPFEQTNILTKTLECPAGSTARSTDNSGELSKIRCHCDDAKKGCPASPKKAK